MILITHDLGVIADVADDVVVMYGGMIMEKADRVTTFKSFHHPYTEGLLQSLPAYGGERERLRAIPGTPPSPINVPAGCPFAARCPYVMDRCRTEVPTLEIAGEEPDHLSSMLAAAQRRRPAGAARQAGPVAAGQRRSVRVDHVTWMTTTTTGPALATCCSGWRTWSSTSR